MSEQLIQLISNQTSGSHIVFNISQRMLKNSEMNATAPIREFLYNESIFDFDKMADAHKEYIECAILHNSQSIVAKIRLGFPPIKREARFWVYGLNNFAKPDENILMTKLDDKLVVIPLDQEVEHLTNIKEVLRNTVLKSKFKKELKRRKRNKKYKAFKKNYIEQALFNTRLGLEGELFVCFSERQKLIDLEKEDLAEMVEHKSETEGDGLGYDILSFDSDGNKKYIEVKTTKGNCNTRFFISPNEMQFSSENSDNYYLYRVYQFNDSEKSGKIKIIKGDISKIVDFEPNSFSGIINE